MSTLDAREPRPDSSSVRQRSRTPNPMSASTDNDARDPSQEDEPLLGRAGDAVQTQSQPLWKNLYLGTGAVAQIGILLLAVLVWAAVLTKPIILFSAHPLFNSAGVLAVSEAILILQPTATAGQKQSGTLAHAALNAFGTVALLAGLAVILYNKIAHAGAHLDSVHAVLGFATYVLLAAQVLVGFTAFYVPALYGGVARAKSTYKYHRASGYVALTLMLATVAAATETDYNKNVLHMRLWAVIVIAVVTLVGVLPRVRLSKLGLK